MKLYLQAIGIAALGFVACNTNPSGDIQSKSSSKPNVILIMADDMGYSDIGCFGGEIHTPNIDKLAEEGLKMTNFYNAARCCPSRASLLTGLYPHQTGVGDMSADDSLVGYRGYLNKQCVTIAEVLEGQGYENMISGKWHVGYPEFAWPMKRGFDKQYPSNGTTGHYFGIVKGRKFIVEDSLIEFEDNWIKSNRVEYQLLKNDDGSQWYATDAFTFRAINYIKDLRSEDEEKPFFLYLPYTAPHWPLHAFEEDVKKYEGKYMTGFNEIRKQRYQRMNELGIIDASWPLSPLNENTEDWESMDDSTKRYNDRLMAVYAAMVDRMDQNIGRLLAALKETGDIDNTLILFLSDNGACHEPATKGDPNALTGTPHSYRGYGYSWANVSNTPFRWYKHWTHEGGTSTPFIAWYPKMIEAGGLDKQVAHITDIMPTIAEITGATYPREYKGNTITPTEGVSLVPVFKGEERQRRGGLYWQHQGNRAVRKGEWKLVCRYDYINMEHLPWELYNIEKDRTELNDLADTYPEKVTELIALYDAWAERVNVVEYGELRKWRRDNWQRKW